TGDGRNQHDAAALASSAHLPHGGTHARERATQMDVDDLIEIVVAHVPQHAVAQDASVSAENVEPAEALHRALHQALGNVGSAHCGDFGRGAATGGFDAVDCGLHRLRVDVVDDDRRTGQRQCLRELEAEPAPTAGDDCDLAGQ